MTTAPSPPTLPTASGFLTWVSGRTGLTWREFFDAWVGGYNLTQTQINSLWNQVQNQGPTPTPPTTPPPTTPTVPPALIIERTPYPKWWKDSYAWPININEAGTWTIIPNTPGYNTYISTIVFTVSGETNIILTFGAFGPTGPMDFGGENEPRGIVMAMGNSPVPCGQTGFKITSDGPGVLVSGFITYYYEAS
jgi:hypothetical protein